jgi:tight adherence protein B
MNWALILIALSACALVVLEFRSIRREHSKLKREVAWPQFEEVFISGLQSGISVSDTFSFANDFELPAIKHPLHRMISTLDRGLPLAQAIEQFRQDVDLAHCDLFTTIVAMAHRTGGQNLLEALQAHANSVRFELAARGDVRARQNAILSVAKLGLLAPWVLVAVLSVNAQTRNSFNSMPGQTLLIVGFAISFIAYRMVVAAGRSASFSRIFGAKLG